VAEAKFSTTALQPASINLLAAESVVSFATSILVS
jgi:hypothetical protein